MDDASHSFTVRWRGDAHYLHFKYIYYDTTQWRDVVIYRFCCHRFCLDSIVLLLFHLLTGGLTQVKEDKSITSQSTCNFKNLDWCARMKNNGILPVALEFKMKSKRGSFFA